MTLNSYSTCFLPGLTFCLILFVFGTKIKAERLSTSQNSFKKAEAAFQQNNCKQVIEILSAGNSSKNLENEVQFVNYYHMLGVCYFKLNEIKKAEKELTELLFISPDFNLDPFTSPPPLLELFKLLKNNVNKKSNELQTIKEKAKEKEPIGNKVNIYSNTSVLFSFMPFGIPQLETNNTTKGIILATTQATFLTGNIAFYWWKKSLLNSDNSVLNKTEFNTAQILQFVSFGVFAGIYIYGVIDALVNHQVLTHLNPAIKAQSLASEMFLDEFKKSKSAWQNN